MRLSLFSSKQCIIKQLLDSVFVISGIIKVEVSVISRSRRLRLITLTSTLISNSNWFEWSTIQGVIGRVISKSAEREARGRFEITSTITPWIVRHEVQLLINRNYNKIREEYDSGLNYLTGIYIQLLSYMPKKKKSHSSATSASLMTRTVQLLRHDAYNCPITSAWRVQLSNYGWNQACWGPIRFENFDIVVIIPDITKTSSNNHTSYRLVYQSLKTYQLSSSC